MNQNNEMYEGNGLNNNNNSNDNNNNDTYCIYGLGVPLTLDYKRKDVYKSNNNNGSSNTIDTFGLSNISAPLPFSSTNVCHKQKKQTDFSPISIGDNKINEINEFNEFNEFKNEKLIFVPSKCIDNNINNKPLIYNEITSMVINDTKNNLLKIFDNILNNISNDIDYDINKSNYIINGQIFIRNFQIFFKISIWNDINGSRFEVRRIKGDTIIFNEFWDEIKQLISKKCNINNNSNNNNNTINNLPPIEYSINLTSNDLNNFIIDINESDPCSVYSIAMVINAIKIQKEFTQIVFKHKQFIKCIIQKTLTHTDTALVRGGLIILEMLCQQIKIASDTLINSFNILENVIPLLSFDCQLIQKYSIRLLYQLSNAKLWTFTNVKLKRFAQINVKRFQKKWENSRDYTNNFIKQKMFDNINNKLINFN